MFTCRKCFLFAAQTAGAPIADLSAKRLGELEAKISELEQQLDEANAPINLDVVPIKELLEMVDLSPKPAKRTPAKKKVSSD